MTIKFSDVLDLFEIVNFGSPYDHQGYICKSTGKTYFYSEFGDNEEELPDDIDEEKYLMIPHKSELNLGRDLVFSFTMEHMPSEYEKIRSIFRSKGAYARFKSLLLDKNFEPENPKKLEELNDTTCRWPIGHPDEKDFYFCGRNPIHSFSYCKLHMLYAFQPKNAKEEDIIGSEDVPEFIEKKIKSA